jgi:hypothetical protein
MLARTGFGDDAALAHAHRQQALAQPVIDFVRTGVEQVFALQVDARAAEMLRQAIGKLQRRGPPREVAQQAFELALEIPVRARLVVGALELLEQRHQSFRHVAATVGTEAATLVGPGLRGCVHFRIPLSR